jgi:hypothetical protein
MRDHFVFCGGLTASRNKSDILHLDANAPTGSSLNRPTGNVTGVAFMFTRLGPKNLEMLHELAPNATVIGVLVNPNNHFDGHLLSPSAVANLFGGVLSVLNP